MKIIAHKENSAIVEITSGELYALTGKPLSKSGYRSFCDGQTVEFCPLIWRVRDFLETQPKLEKAAEILRGLATVISTVDALVPQAPEPTGKGVSE